MSSLSWKRASSLAGLQLSDDQKASPDWPNAFDFQKVAILQYPGDGTPSGGRQARRDRAALIAALKEAAEKDEISVEQLSIQVEAFKDIPVRRCPHEGVDKSVNIDPQSWRDIGGRFKTISAGFETVVIEIVSRANFGRWLEKQGEPPSEHIRAWFEAAASESEELDTKLQRLTELKRSAIINQLGQRYPSLEADFNRGESWTKECSSGRRGMYYLEKIEEGCRKKWGERPHLQAVQTYRLGK